MENKVGIPVAKQAAFIQLKTLSRGESARKITRFDPDAREAISFSEMIFFSMPLILT